MISPRLFAYRCADAFADLDPLPLENTMPTGIMLTDVHLLGTDLKLQEGQHVYLVEATNLSDGEGCYFACPLDGQWSCGVEQLPGTSILLNREGDVHVNPSCPQKGSP